MRALLAILAAVIVAAVIGLALAVAGLRVTVREVDGE